MCMGPGAFARLSSHCCADFRYPLVLAPCLLLQVLSHDADVRCGALADVEAIRERVRSCTICRVQVVA